MIDVSHVLVLSQNELIEPRVCAELNGAARGWPALFWPFRRR